MWPGFLAAQIVREYSLLLIFLCKIFPEKLDKARGGRRGILDSPFQSTPPRGGRLLVVSVTVGVSLFQSTPPARGATRRAVNCFVGFFGFQSTPPARGATDRMRHAQPRAAHFNPRPPRGGRLVIVTPLAALPMVFQSTPPARGATGRAGRHPRPVLDFNPRPPRGGRRGKYY